MAQINKVGFKYGFRVCGNIGECINWVSKLATGFLNIRVTFGGGGPHSKDDDIS